MVPESDDFGIVVTIVGFDVSLSLYDHGKVQTVVTVIVRALRVNGLHLCDELDICFFLFLVGVLSGFFFLLP